MRNAAPEEGAFAIEIAHGIGRFGRTTEPSAPRFVDPATSSGSARVQRVPRRRSSWIRSALLPSSRLR
ncbi:hypothetical protein Mnod_1482 [Methylobacterium nodulans ORS 2060]|uniref:Uncharacterized protein n=1 Tax=Methylobacterium nodulans (strain LMG 21967 / CNCM I-2342 / ORS 2060) TaxID=460265 RepID=B8INE8_METNO|nr:hypothetical protein Mnod_1482 [Methylobacterium nodulans ORS 2060]